MPHKIKKQIDGIYFIFALLLVVNSAYVIQHATDVFGLYLAYATLFLALTLVVLKTWHYKVKNEL